MENLIRKTEIPAIRIAYRHTIGNCWFFFSRLAFKLTLILLILRYSILLRTKFLLNSRGFRRLFTVIVGISLLLASSSCTVSAVGAKVPIFADEIIVLFVQGDVMVKTQRSVKWISATVGMKLLKGDGLKTGINSWAEIDVSSYKRPLRIKEGTFIELSRLSPIKVK